MVLMTSCRICDKNFCKWDNKKKYCENCDRKFREFIVLFTRLIEEILDFYFVENGERN